MRKSAQNESGEAKDVVVVEHIEESESPGSKQTIGDADGVLLAPSRRTQAERQLVRALDMRLLPTIILIFIMNYIDVRSSGLSFCWNDITECRELQ